MLAPKFIPFILKQVVRRRTRSLLTVAGVAMAMFLFCGVQALQRGVEAATETTSRDATLVVYRQNRYCPFTSNLPEFYRDRITKVPGVRSVVPMRIVVNNCRASLDVVTFRGVPEDSFHEMAPSFEVIAGSADDWYRRGDAALIGERLAQRRGLKVGESLDAAGLKVTVAGIIRSSEPQDQDVGYVHLPFLQRAAIRAGDGIVTQFNVKVDDPSRLKEVAAAIDAEFASDQAPTQTRPEKDFVARAAADVVQLVGFTRWLGWAALAAVLALVGNAIVLSVQDRIKEHAILQTLGYRGWLIARLIVGEGLLLGLVGGAAGSILAVAVLRWGRFTMSVDGVNLGVSGGPALLFAGLAISATLGIVAGLVPAWQASRRRIAECFRSV